jgi:hypothetical protein
MKKIFYSILLSGMMVLSACDALDLSPEDYYGSNDFWNQKSQVEMFMTGIHADLRDKYQMPVTLGEFRSEILISDVTSMGEGVYGPPMTNNLLTKDNTGVDDWYEVYPNIMHINLFIRNVDKEKEWCQSWIEEILAINENVTLDPIRKSYISNALANIWWCAVRDGTESYRG